MMLKVALIGVIVVGWFITTPTQTNTSRWAGYVYEHPVSDVSATIVLPASPPCGPSEDSTVSAWVGLDENTTVEQTVAFVNCLDGTDYYGVVYQMWPDTYHRLPVTVHAGDTVVLAMDEQYPGTYKTSAYDESDGSAATAVVGSATAANASAECDVESDPSIGLLRFGQISFRDCVANGDVGIPGAATEALSIVVNGTVVTHNVLQSSTDFTVTGPT